MEGAREVCVNYSSAFLYKSHIFWQDISAKHVECSGTEVSFIHCSKFSRQNKGNLAYLEGQIVYS